MNIKNNFIKAVKYPRLILAAILRDCAHWIKDDNGMLLQGIIFILVAN